MKPKTTRILYWILIIFFSLFMLADGIAGVVQEKNGQDVMRHLGYPMYALIIFGMAKIAGAIALLQTKFKTIKEWAFAGFTINFTGAFASRAFAGDGIGQMVMPLVILAFMFFVYAIWKRYEQIKTA